MILHLHGFRSVGNNAKYYILKRSFRDEKVISPTLPCNPPQTLSLIETIIADNDEPTIVVGTSLGGFYAFYTAVVHDIPAALVNPALKPWESLQNQVGIQKRIETGDRFEWKAEYLLFLKGMGDTIENVGISDHNLNFFLSTDDELIDHSYVPLAFPFARNIEFYDNSGHIFIRFQELIPYFKEILEEAKLEQKVGNNRADRSL